MMLHINKDEKVEEQYTKNEEEFRKEDPWVNPKPHTIIPLLILCAIAVYVAFVRDTQRDVYSTESNVKMCELFLYD